MSFPSSQTTLLTSPTVGLEDLQRAAFYIFYENLNLVLPEVDAYWYAKDQEFDVRTGRRTARPTVCEPIQNSDFHEGHKPSLVLSTPDHYPNLSVFATRADPSAEDSRFDQLQSWSDQILVEVMVKAKTTEEDLVNRRIQRTAEATVICLRQNPTLGGACTGMEGAPTVVVSDVFAIKGDQKTAGTGERHLWQGASITWRIRKDSVPPAADGQIFARATTFDYSQADIDQR